MGLSVKFPKLFPWSKEVFDEVVNDNGKGGIYVVKAKRQVSKSVTAIAILLHYAFKNAGSIGVIIEPTLNQSRRVYKQLLKSIGGDNSPLIKSANASLLNIEFINGSEICLKSAEQGDALRGTTVKKSVLVIDEAAFIEDEIFEILYPTVDANNCPVLLISTPLFESGEFYTKYCLGLGDGGVVKSFNWTEWDTSALLPKAKLEFYRETLSKLKFQSEYLGEFIKEGSYIFGDISKCIKNLSNKPAVWAGVDWAVGNGGDYTVLIMLDAEGNICYLDAFKDIEPTAQVERIAAAINKNPSLRAVQVELNSIGSVYYNMLQKKVRKVIGFNTTNDSKREIIENLITAFNMQTIGIINDRELIKELQHYTVEKTKKGYTYNGADNVNDDYVMALAFAFDAYEKSLGTFRIAVV